MTYVVVSPRVGTPGEPYKPPTEADAQRLLAGGFIAKVSTPKPKPASKVKKASKE